MVEALGWLAFVAGFLGTLILMSDYGFRPGLQRAWFVATLAVPGWFLVNFRSITLDAVAGVAVASILLALARPFAGMRTRWVLSDLLLAGIVLAGLLSDALNRILIPGTVVELVRNWVFPYLIGRLAFAPWDELKRVLPLVVVLATILSAFGVIEAVSQVNLLAEISGKEWALLETAEGFRWGLKRAQGNTNHPIYFGLLLTLILPWLLVAARSAWRKEGPRWWLAAPVLATAAAFVTVARSAHLAVLIVYTADLFFRRPNYRLPMLLLTLMGGLTFVVFWEEAMDLLGAYAGENEVGEDKVRIYGEEYDYTGTRHRDLLVLAYADAIDHAGWIGYGTTTQDMPRDPFMDSRFNSIDHHYLLHFLRYGMLGMAAFIVFAAAVAWNLAREAWQADGRLAELAAGLFGAFVAVTVMVRGVALSPDFGATWLFVAGLAASMRAARLAATDLTRTMTAAGPGAEPPADSSRRSV